MIKTNLKVNKRLTDLIAKNLKNAKQNAFIGWFQEDDARPDGNSNLEIVNVHIHGSYTRNIPKRDPIYEPFKRDKKEIKEFFVKSVVSKLKTNENLNIVKSLNTGLKDSALYVQENVIKSEISTGGQGKWEQLQSKTIKRKNGNKQQLVDTKYLYDTVKFKIEQ